MTLGKVRRNGVWNNDLQCYFIRWRKWGPETLQLFLVEDNCCDMSGAISIGSSLLPDVAVIQTYSGGLPDTRYERLNNGQWIAYERRGFWPRTINDARQGQI